MADLQKQFEEFHKTIRLDKENEGLREKRDIILDRIRKHLKENDLPGVRPLLQGSYAMGVGTVPPEGQEFDIDVGLRFSFSEDECEADAPRAWIYAAVKDHTDNVEEKTPCIRVTYADGYHVDLVVYANWTDVFGREHYRLAHKDRGWVEADPPGLLDFVKEARKPFKGTEDSATKTDQFRRVVRYLKRWNDAHLPGDRDDKPSGLALMLLAAKYLSRPATTLAEEPDDRAALERVARNAVLAVGRLTADKPTPEYEDVLKGLSDEAMDALKDRFEKLGTALREAASETDPVEACEILAGVLGDDFPVPAREETAKQTEAPAILTTSSSA